jgi:hypothetical protein
MQRQHTQHSFWTSWLPSSPTSAGFKKKAFHQRQWQNASQHNAHAQCSVFVFGCACTVLRYVYAGTFPAVPLQAVIEEQRNVGVHCNLLDTLVALKSRLCESFVSANEKRPTNSVHMHHLCTFGKAPAVSSAEAAADLDCALIDPGAADVTSTSALALSGLDPVVFVRHGGLPCVASTDVACLRAPAQNGRLCALLHSCGLG